MKSGAQAERVPKSPENKGVLREFGGKSLVERKRIELSTPTLRTWCSTK